MLMLSMLIVLLKFGMSDKLIRTICNNVDISRCKVLWIFVGFDEIFNFISRVVK